MLIYLRFKELRHTHKEETFLQSAMLLNGLEHTRFQLTVGSILLKVLYY